MDGDGKSDRDGYLQTCKPVEFIQVEGENHAIYDYNKRIQWNYAIYAWFAKWLKGDSRWWDSMYSEDN